MQGVSVNSIPCLSGQYQTGDRKGECKRQTCSEMQKTRAIAQDLIFWIFNDLLVPLIRVSYETYLACHVHVGKRDHKADMWQNTFYVTETASTKYTTVYFLHEHWSEAVGPHFAALEADLLEPLSSVSSEIRALSAMALFW